MKLQHPCISAQTELNQLGYGKNPAQRPQIGQLES